MKLMVILVGILVLLPIVQAQERPLILVHGLLTKSVGAGMCPWPANETKTNAFRGLQSHLVQEGLYSAGGTISWNSTGCPSNRGKPPVFTFSYYDECYADRDAIATYAARFEQAVKHVRNCTDSDSVDIVAHSMGGLVVRDYIQNNNGSDIHSVIFLATPQGGVNTFPTIFGVPGCILYFWCPNEVSELFSTSALVKNLSSIKSLSIPTFSINSKNDMMIPKESPTALHTDYTTEVECSHDNLIRPRACPDSYEKMKQYLKLSFGKLPLPANVLKMKGAG